MKRYALRSIDRAFDGTSGPGRFLEILVTRMTAGRTENQSGLMSKGTVGDSVSRVTSSRLNAPVTDNRMYLHVAAINYLPRPPSVSQPPAKGRVQRVF